MISNLEPVIAYPEMVDALVKLEQNTFYEEVDITGFRYDRASEWGVIDDQLGTRYELTEWSCKQLCKLAGIPFTFFKKSTPDLAQEAFHEWVPLAKNPQVKLAVKEYGTGKKVLRGVLPADYPEIRNSDILKSVTETGLKFEVESAGWIDQIDAPIMRTRFVVADISRSLGQDDDVHIGVDILSSELGACPLEVNLLLYRTICKNGAIAVYDGRPYFFFDYKQNMAFPVEDILDSVGKRIKEQQDQFFFSVENARRVLLDSNQAKLIIAEMQKTEAINKGVAVKTIQNIDKSAASTGWDVVNALTASARGFRDRLRLRYESAAGSLLGLRFDRVQGKDDSYATSAPERALPPAFSTVTP